MTSLCTKTINHPREKVAQPIDYEDNTYFLNTQPTRSQVRYVPTDRNNNQDTTATTLIVVDTNIDYAQWLAAGITENANLLILQPDQDGVEQISKAMRTYGCIQQLHILAYGSPACIYLGNTELSLETLSKYRLQLLTWFMNRLRWASDATQDDSSPECLYTPACSLSFYACRLAAGEMGSEFLQRLHYLTGAQIAASTQPIGNQVLGGTWQLDMVISDRVFYTSGASHSVPDLPIDLQTLAAYPALLSSAM